MTSGNHIWDKKEIIGVIDLIPQLLRPLNYPAAQPGRGSHVGKAKRSKVPVATLNLSGRVFMNGAMDDPFTLGLAEVERLAPGGQGRSSSTCTARPRPRRWRSATTSTAR